MSPRAARSRTVARRRPGPVAALACALALGTPASAAVDWRAHADVDTVTVVTRREDGTLRDTTVWLVVVEGQGYLRTGSTRWGADVERNAEVALRVGGAEHPLRAVFVTDPDERERVTAAFREKYGFVDRMLSLFRGSEPVILRLEPRGEGGGAS